jgi:predicted dehydrogenase
VSRAWGDGERPKEIVSVPSTLHWDLWLGPAPERPFHPSYISGQPRWYKYWDFGGGTLPDLGSHWNDLPFWALNLRHPLRVEAKGPPVSRETAPASYQVSYEYGARAQMPPVKLTWYQGENKPALFTERKIPAWDNGVLFIGEKGMLLSDYHKHKLLPEEKYADFKRPEPSIPKSIGHWKEWIEACKTGKPTTCNFDYAGALTEANHLGNVAYRTGKRLEWDAARMTATNCSDAANYIRMDYRKGWTLA